MALLKAEAEKLSVEQLERGVIEEFIERDALWAFLPFMRVDSKAYVYNREGSLATGDWLGPNTDVNEAASTFSQVTAYLKILIGDVDVDKFLDATHSDHNSQLAIQIASKAKGMARQYKEALIKGSDGGTPESSVQWNGLRELALANSNEVNLGAGGTSLTLSHMDELGDLIPNGPDAYIMNSIMLRKLKALWRSAGGNTGSMLQIENFGLPIPAHDGVPILVNDYIVQTDGSGNDCSHIYAVRFNLTDGLHGIYGGDNAGFSVENIGTVQNRDATRTRLKFYNGLCLKSTKSLAMVKNAKV